MQRNAVKVENLICTCSVPRKRLCFRKAIASMYIHETCRKNAVASSTVRLTPDHGIARHSHIVWFCIGPVARNLILRFSGTCLLHEKGVRRYCILYVEDRARHKCELCGCRFTFRSNLNRHMNKVHRKRSPLRTLRSTTDNATVSDRLAVILSGSQQIMPQ